MPTSAREPLLAVSGWQSGYGKIARAARRRPRTSTPARSSRCSARTAPARPRCCAPCRACCRGTPAGPLRRPRPAQRRTRAIRRAPGWCTSSRDIACSPRSQRHRQPAAGRLRPAAAASAARDRGGAGLLPRDRRQAQRPRRRAAAGSSRCWRSRRASCGAAAADAGRAVGRPVAGAGRSRARRGASLRAAGTAVLLVEQLIEKALAVADRVYALAQGRVVLEAPANEPDLPQRLERAYFGGSEPN